MIEVKNLTKRYGSNVAIDHVSFSVDEGTIVGFLGPNGAGKSTTMNIITGYLSATEGSVTVSGHSILDEPSGLLKAVVDADTGQILGVHLFCADSPELANLAKLAMDAQVPYTVMRDAIYTHPTMAEAFNNLFAAIDAS